MKEILKLKFLILFLIFVLTINVVNLNSVLAGAKGARTEVDLYSLQRMILTNDSDKGIVKGFLISSKTKEPLARVLVLLCKVISEEECILNNNFITLTDENGGFNFKDVPSGRYTLAYDKEKKTTDVSFEEVILGSETLALKMQRGRFEMGKFMDGVFMLALSNFDLFLNFEVRGGKFVEFEATANQTTEIKIETYY